MAVSVFLIGCGSSGGSSSEINSGNSQNEYGYYGGSTLLGDYSASRYWALIDANNYDALAMLLDNAGNFSLANSHDIIKGKYGISGDAKTLESDVLNSITIMSNSDFEWYADGQKVQCYNTTGGDRPIILCPHNEIADTSVDSVSEELIGQM